MTPPTSDPAQTGRLIPFARPTPREARPVLTVSQMSGSLDHGGERFGWLFIVGEARVRIWRMRNGSAVPGPIPEAVTARIVDSARAFHEAMVGR